MAEGADEGASELATKEHAGGQQKEAAQDEAVAEAKEGAATAGEAQTPQPKLGPDGEPMPDTITGADPKLEGNDPEWKSGQAAASPSRTDARDSDAQADGPLANPTRDGKAHRYELRAYDTNIEVFMDGMPVPAERVRVRGTQVGVVDENGTLIERLDLPEHWTEDAQHAATPSATDPYDFRDVKGNKLTPPKVMLGGRLVEPSTAVLKHLSDRGVRRDRVSMITNVIPELPLALAGLENDDIVLAANEVPDADPGTIRALLRTMKPGDSISLRILRGNTVMDARVTLAPWEAKHMVRPLGTGGHQPRATQPGTPDVAALEEELARAKVQIATLERQLNDRDPARRAIRPQPIPQPK